MKRIILSVVAGFVINSVAASVVDIVLQQLGIFPPYGQPFFDTALVLLASTHRAILSVLSAYVVALIARDKARTATIAFGVLGSIFWVIGGFAAAGYSPIWYSVIGFFLSVPYALLGLKLYNSRQQRKHSGTLTA